MTLARRVTAPTKRARGAAIVLAMLVAALAAALAATVFGDQQRWNRSVEHRRDQVQAQALVIAGVQWARQVLYDDAQRSDIDHRGEPWAMSLPPIPVENGEIRGSIVDAQGRLNINALGSSDAADVAQRDRIAMLFAKLRLSASVQNAIADWIDADGVVRDGGAEDEYYAKQPVRGLAANTPIVRIAELAQVAGLSAQSVAAVAPFLSALPAGSALNVNTAAPEVLAAVVGNLAGAGLASLVADRAQKPYTSVADFRARLPREAKLATDTALAVKSSYFEVTVEARQGETIARARALLHRPGSEWPVIVWEVVE
jgi:general secretion pathway protein K